MPCKCATNCATAPGRARDLLWATREILANGPRRTLIGVGCAGGEVVRRDPQLPGPWLVEQRPPAVVHRREVVGGLEGPAEHAGDGHAEAGAVQHEHPGLAVAEAVE